MRIITKRKVLVAGFALTVTGGLLGVHAAVSGEGARRPSAAPSGGVRAQSVDDAGPRVNPNPPTHGSLNEAYNADYPNDPTKEARFSAIIENHGYFVGKVCIKNSVPANYCTSPFDEEQTLNVGIEPGNEYAEVTGSVVAWDAEKTLRLVVNTGANPRRCLNMTGSIFDFTFEVADDCDGFPT